MLLLAALAACAPTTRPTDGSPSAGTAELIAPGVLSTNANEYNPSLSPDGRTLVFARSAADFRTPAILVSRLERGEWSTPRPVPFADPRFGDSDPTFAPDGRTLYFISDRPAPGRDASRRDLDLWRVRFDAGRWGTPEHLGNEVNGPGQELGPAWHDGWLYFGSTRGGQARMLDLFRARDTGEGFGRRSRCRVCTPKPAKAIRSFRPMARCCCSGAIGRAAPAPETCTPAAASRRDGARPSLCG
jgi:hypothetical protein